MGPEGKEKRKRRRELMLEKRTRAPGESYHG